MSNDGPSQDAMIALSIGTAVPGLWGFFCPAPTDQGSVDLPTIRLQQSKAAAASLSIGFVGTAIAHKPWPFLVSLALVGLMMWEYETHRKRLT